jgi:hypothetical protein
MRDLPVTCAFAVPTAGKAPYDGRDERTSDVFQLAICLPVDFVRDGNDREIRQSRLPCLRPRRNLKDSGHHGDRRHARTFPRNRVKHTARRARASFTEPVDDCLGFFADPPDKVRRGRGRHLRFHFPVCTDRPELIVQQPF